MSLTIKSLLVGAVLLVAQHAGVSLTEGQLHEWLDTTGKLIALGGALVSMALAWYGRVRLGDVDALGRRFNDEEFDVVGEE